MADLRERNMEEHERAPFPTEATDIVDAVASRLVNSGNLIVDTGHGKLKLYAAYRPKSIETGYEPDLVMFFQQGDGGKDVRVELDLRINNPR